MGDLSRAARLRVHRTLLPTTVTIAALALVAFGAIEARAQQAGIDRQAIPLGNGKANSACVDPGPNAMLQSTAAGDDVPLGALGTNSQITTGPDGICDTSLTGDDTYVAGFTLGGGSPFQSVIVAGSAGLNNGICDKISTGGGDDVVEAGVGKSTPRQVGIRRGSNNVLNSSPSGDDVTTAVICAEPVGGFDSTPAGDDVIAANDVRCTRAGCAASSCIVPGPNDTLETTVNANDTSKAYISTGADGIENSTLSGDDQY